MRILLIVFRILIGLMFVFSGVIKLFPVETFELTFVDLGITSWGAAPFIARFLIAIEIGLGVLLLIGVWKKRVLQFCLLLLSIFSIYLIYLLIAKGNDVNCGCFGQGIPMTPIQSLIKNLGFGMLTITLLKLDYFEIAKKWKKIVGYITLVVSLAIPFILNPVELAHNVHNSEEPFELDITGIPQHIIDGDSVALNKGEVIVAFLSVSCSHCKNAAYKLKIAQQKYNLPRIVCVFIGKEEKIDDFWRESNSRFPYVFYKNKRVFKITSGKFPTIMYLKDGIVQKHWTGKTFNYFELEKLEEVH